MQLTADQQAIDHRDGNLRLIACAGSGKTKVVARRDIKATLRIDIDPEEWKLETESQPFPVRGHKRIAGNESTVVKELE